MVFVRSRVFVLETRLGKILIGRRFEIFSDVFEKMTKIGIKHYVL